MKLAVPYHEQETEYTCGPASLQMAFLLLGKFKSEKTIAVHAETNREEGTRHRGMIAAALREKFYCYVNADSSIKEIKYFINLGFPVVIDYTEPSSEEGHYAVVSGYKNKHIILSDSWNGKDFTLTETELVSRWYDPHNGHNGCNQWMMVVSKEPFSLGKQYIPEAGK
ncbi:MAG: Pseudomurein-binding repeat-containing protein [Parcubacteria group bacterium GW2011_GWA1_47_8]|nr:MAG: Pseudomurein-binding repeat-containing protein [Parcubacteria group bacterium GW2011_GWA1_47_8]